MAKGKNWTVGGTGADGRVFSDGREGNSRVGEFVREDRDRIEGGAADRVRLTRKMREFKLRSDGNERVNAGEDRWLNEIAARTNPGIQAQSTGRSLVLLDEVGAGTNPLEGAALGISLLESFADSGSLLTIATTHQGELKTLKYSNDRFENACVEFDEENLRPTYKLLWGIPGRSNAISIAGRLGLPTDILDNAQQLYGKDSAEINKVIIDLENAKQAFQEDLLATEYYLKQSRILYQRLVAVNDQILEYSTLQQYRKMHEIFAAAADARSALHRKMRNFRESTSKASLAVANSLRDDRTRDLNVSVESSTDRLPGKTNQVPRVGQVLHLPSFGKKVKVLKVNEDKNELLVQSGNLKFKLSLSEWRT